MDCKDIQNNIIFYLEGDLSKTRQKSLESHIDNCKKCREYLQFIKSTLGILEEEKQKQANPFLATRVMNTIEQESAPAKTQNTVFVWLQHAVAVIILIIGIFWGVTTGINMEQKVNQEQIAGFSTEYYINDIKQENIPLLLDE